MELLGQIQECIHVEVASWKHDNDPESCGENPCIWESLRQTMVTFDESEHGLLLGNNIPSDAVRREILLQRIINSGAPDHLVGEKHQHYLNCVKNGILTLIPDIEGMNV